MQKITEKNSNKLIPSVIDDSLAIKVDHLFGVYNEGKENQFVSLCDINYSFEKNKIYCIIGNSGSGKSTLVTHFNGLLKSRYGDVQIEDNEKIGAGLYLQDYFLGLINENSMPLEMKKDFYRFQKQSLNKKTYLAAFKKCLPSKTIKILVEAYYKQKVIKVKHLNDSKSNGHYFAVCLEDNEYEIDPSDFKDYFQIESLLENFPSSFIKDQINKINFLWQKKLANKKIKNIKNVRRTVGMVFQFPEYQLFKDTIIKDVTFGPIALGINKGQAQEKAKFYLQELGIPESYLERSPFGLSGGQKRRVAIAGILAIEPKVLIFDEPTAGLDPVGEDEMLNIILNAKENGKTVIVITHTMDHVLKIADEVIVMNDGEIIDSGTPYKIFTNDELLKNTSIDSPKVIKVINDLVDKEPKFKKLYELAPKNVDELANAIYEILANDTLGMEVV